jgi:processive 1,2-diacylglycerol beta-glucosyltransferase
LVKAHLGDYQGLIQFRVLGFTLDMPRLMASADLLVGKPGGLTTSEALAAGLPFAIVQPYPLQEEANANYLLEHGAGMRIEPLTLLTHKLRSFFEDQQRREQMRAAALRLAKPEAARTVVRSLLDKPLPHPSP